MNYGKIIGSIAQHVDIKAVSMQNLNTSTDDQFNCETVDGVTHRVIECIATEIICLAIE